MKTNERKIVTHFLETDKAGFIAWHSEKEFYVNLSGNYNHLERPYYVSQDLEISDIPVHPTCEEMLDAYITPICLEKAGKAGIAIPQFYISNGYFEPPVIIDPINPFTNGSRVIMKSGRENSIARSMTRNNTYAICCQEIPAGSRIVNIRSVLGWCTIKKYREFACSVWEVFRIPLAKVRLIATLDNRLLFSGIAPLLLDSLGMTERKYVEGCVEWEK